MKIYKLVYNIFAIFLQKTMLRDLNSSISSDEEARNNSWLLQSYYQVEDCIKETDISAGLLKFACPTQWLWQLIVSKNLNNKRNTSIIAIPQILILNRLYLKTLRQNFGELLVC